MVDAELLKILVCPENRTPLRLAEAAEIEKVNAAIAAGAVKTRGGREVHEPIQGGLIRQDGTVLYPIVDRIPVLLIDEAIRLAESKEP